MDTKDRLAKSRGFIAGMTGFFAGALVSNSVDLSTWAKAALAAGICAAVAIILLAVLPRSTDLS